MKDDRVIVDDSTCRTSTRNLIGGMHEIKIGGQDGGS